MPDVLCRRYFPPLAQLREVDGDGLPDIVGLAAVYYDGTPRTEYELWPGLVERIRPGAFAKSVREDDVRSLWNHDSGMVLGRRRRPAGDGPPSTMRIWDDADGLRYEVAPPDNHVGRMAVTTIDRGDVDGSSIGFFIRGYEWEDQGELEVRWLTEFELLDISPVTYPAYEATTVGLRSELIDLTEARESYDVWKTGKRSDSSAAAELEMAHLRMRASRALAEHANWPEPL